VLDGLNNADLRKDVPFGFRLYCCPFKGSNSQKPIGGPNRRFQAKRKKNSVSYFRNYCIDCNQILHSDKDRQVPFAGGPNMPQTNSRWRTAAVFKNRKIAVLLQRVVVF